jgi:hypothetical protein
MQALLMPEFFFDQQSLCMPSNDPDFEQDLLSIAVNCSNPLPSSPICTKLSLKSVLQHIHISRCPHFDESYSSQAKAITESFQKRVRNLLRCNLLQIQGYILCWQPFFKPHDEFSYRDYILYLLCLEYSTVVVDIFLKSSKDRRKQYYKNACIADCNMIASTKCKY